MTQPTAQPNSDPDRSAIEGAPPVLPEVRTRRLVVVDAAGSPRITGEVTETEVAELRLELPASSPERASVLLFANPGDAAEGPTVGVQLWTGSDAFAELNLWREGNRWRAASYVEADTEPG